MNAAHPDAVVDSRARIRPGCAADRNFVLSSWLRSARDLPTFALWDNARYFDEATGYKAAIERALASADSRLLVACNPADEDQILGFVAHAARTPPVLQYVYVKQAFRRHGIGVALCRAAIPGFGAAVTACSSQAHGWPALRDRFRLHLNPYELT